MITLNVEIRYANTLDGAESVTPVSKADLESDIVGVALDVLEQMYQDQGGLTESFIIVPSPDWMNLPNELYLVEEYEGSNPVTFALIERKLNCPEAELIPLHLAFEPDSLFSPPDMVLDIYSGEG